jgi:hypothetical protein
VALDYTEACSAILCRLLITQASPRDFDFYSQKIADAFSGIHFRISTGLDFKGKAELLEHLV